MSDRELTKQLEDARKELLRQIVGLDEQRMRARPAEGEWSIVEVLAHSIDVDRHYLAQALAIRDTAGYLFVHFDDGKWKTENPNANNRPLAEVLTALEGSFREVVDTLASLGQEELERVGRHPRGISYRVRDVFLRWPAHDRVHSQQMRAVRTALGHAS
jgi:uncharacterized damage-inducible protein DinB